MSDFRFRSEPPYPRPPSETADFRFPLAQSPVSVWGVVPALTARVYVSDPARIEAVQIGGALPIPTLRGGLFTPSAAFEYGRLGAGGEARLLLSKRSAPSTRLTFNEPIDDGAVTLLAATGRLPSPTAFIALEENATHFDLIGTLPPISGAVRVAQRIDATLTVALPGLAVTAALEYQTQAARPAVGYATAVHQVARPLSAGVQQVQHSAQKSPTGWQSAWQRAESALETVEHRLPDGLVHAPLGLESPFWAGTGLRLESRSRQQEGTAVPLALKGRFHRGAHLERETPFAHQEADRGKRTLLLHPFDKLTPLHAARHRGHFADATPLSRGWVSWAQTARVPRAGANPVEPPKPTLCYTPSGDLVFRQRWWNTSTALLFLCDGQWPAPIKTPVVIPIQRVLLVNNNVTLKRVADNLTIPAVSMSLRLDAASWVWGFEATLPAQAQALIEPTQDGPVELSAWVNGTEFRVFPENLTRERTFGRTVLRVSGRGRHALLDAPYAPTLSFTHAQARTHQQLFDDVLTFNGVPLGWSIDYKLEAWNVPAGVFTHQGTYISALKALARAAGAYLLPHRTAMAFKVLPLYPLAPWQWDEVTPDFVLPSAVVSRESIAWKDKPLYNRVFVSGQEQGVLGQVTRAGTAGDLLAPMATDPLITTAAAARQRGLSILSDTGRQLEVGLRLPVLPATGVIQPGAFVQYEDDGLSRLGLVRSSSIEVGLPEVYQTLEVECHA